MASDVAGSAGCAGWRAMKPRDLETAGEDAHEDGEAAALPQHCSLAGESPSGSLPPTPGDLEGIYAFEAFDASALEVHQLTSRGVPSTAREGPVTPTDLEGMYSFDPDAIEVARRKNRKDAFLSDLGVGVAKKQKENSKIHDMDNMRAAVRARLKPRQLGSTQLNSLRSPKLCEQLAVKISAKSEGKACPRSGTPVPTGRPVQQRQQQGLEQNGRSRTPVQREAARGGGASADPEQLFKPLPRTGVGMTCDGTRRNQVLQR